ncbi:putative NBD/HSP70 family sugar kinase [Caldalkalibacillus uzonensis]|uniref:NBD/HSP70 family sugar kinase n=1 Tax=Caldalkalibacillus uzonensis TaxID=353224 RepID=A0ABU0CPG5_9BACI|nr:ROK family protein [Caldalkalibacillus uzonensis]MDQ0338303.1 putative NBD/HSP70 family sugar kinase [Caldalkalibacillus uzonensis]
MLNTNKKIDVKLTHKISILEYVRCRIRTTKPQIAKDLGISTPTASSLVDELIEEGYLKVDGTGSSTELGGKRPKIIAFHPRGKSIIAVHLGIELLDMALIDLSASILFRIQERNRRDESKEQLLHKLTLQVGELIKKAEDLKIPVLGIGVGSPGLVETKTGTIRDASNFSILNNVNLGDLLSERFNKPVWVDNECKNLSLAEKWFGQDEAQTIISLMTDGGIGAGVIIDNQMMRGIDDSFGEIGHTTLNFNGPKCRCGNRGCWETYASSDALLKQVSENMNQTTWLKQMVDSAEDLTLPLIAKAVENGDPVVEQIAIYDLGTYLGIGIANLVNTFNPELVIIHGEMSCLGERLLEHIRYEMHMRALPIPAARVNLKFSKLGRNANIMGAGALVLKELFENPECLFNS